MDILETAIQAEGGVGKLAAALDVKQNVISNWRARGLPKPWSHVLTMRYAKPSTPSTKRTKAIEKAVV